MKTLTTILITLITINLCSQNSSKIKEYLNEQKESEDISVTKVQIKKRSTPPVSFSIEGKRGVNEAFLKDEFVQGAIAEGAIIGDNGDLSFEPVSLEKISYEDSLKDDEQYTDEEIAQFRAIADSYYEFKDFDAYEDFYYYYDQSALEKCKICDEGFGKKSSKNFKKAVYSLLTAAISFLPAQVSLSLNPYLDDAINYYDDGNRPQVNYDIANAAGANKALLKEAVNYYKSHKGQFSNHRFMAVLEFHKHSAKSRFYIINLNKMAVVAAYHVAHGSGSDRDNDGYATYFSNQPNSKASSIGVYKTGEIYSGKYGRSLRLHGLSPTNSNVYRRAIVIHPSPYVKEANVKPGRSWGCMAFDYKVSGDVINMLRNGGFIYAKYTR
ncbi:MAG: murein L,D-transpeptidase catalytic domain family protein [Elusimicrobiales bacterium]|nr:murein L,D-transpeptidase catalytic domain family protein [Elusimicrobiales bacterium]